MHRLDRSAGKQLQAEQEPTCTKIYYASRTHSQLSQVLHELTKLKIGISSISTTSSNSESRHDEGSGRLNGGKRGIAEIERDHDDGSENVDIRTVSLGSRKQLCVNEELKAKVVDLDEACRQLLGGECPICVYWALN